MARKTADEASKTRSSILDAALFVFAERGVHAARLEEIAQRASVTRGALYHHFAGKPELLYSVLSERWVSAMEPVLEPLRGRGGVDAVRTFVHRFLECVDTNPTVRALLKLSLSGELVSVEAEGLPEKTRVWCEWLELLDRNVGKTCKRCDLRTKSEGVLHALLGYALWSSLFGPSAAGSYELRTAQILAGISQ